MFEWSQNLFTKCIRHQDLASMSLLSIKSSEAPNNLREIIWKGKLEKKLWAQIKVRGNIN